MLRQNVSARARYNVLPATLMLSTRMTGYINTYTYTEGYIHFTYTGCRAANKVQVGVRRQKQLAVTPLLGCRLCQIQGYYSRRKEVAEHVSTLERLSHEQMFCYYAITIIIFHFLSLRVHYYTYASPSERYYDKDITTFSICSQSYERRDICLL